MRFPIALILATAAMSAPAQPSSRVADTSGIKVSPGYSVTVYAAGLAEPRGLLFTPAGDLYVAEQGSGDVSKISPNGELLVCELYSGRVVAYKGQAFSRVVASGLNWPHGLAFHPSGAIFVNENQGNRIVRVDPDGTVRPFAQVPRPVGLVLAKSGNLFVAQPQVGRISRVAPDGRVTVLLENLKEPRDPAFDAAGNLYFAETLAGRVIKLTGEF